MKWENLFHLLIYSIYWEIANEPVRKEEHMDLEGFERKKEMREVKYNQTN